jgi:hypothetical protein
VSLYLNGAYRRFGNANSWILGDTSLYFGIQILRDQKNQWTPDLRLLLGEIFPTGKYDHLNPHKNGSDAFGEGAFNTAAILVIAKTFYIFPKHPYNLNFNLCYSYSSEVTAHSYSVYSNSLSARGKALPHSGFVTNLAIEYSLNQFWALGMDMRYTHQDKVVFKPARKSADQLGLPSSEQFSLAPCLEYSWSENLSAAIGPWFTIAGRNSETFFGMIGNVFCYF